MDINALIVLLSTITGWIIIHLLERRRDELNKKQAIRINFLIESWRLLESASNRENNDLNHNIETAIADIQLFGSPKQIELAQNMAEQLATSGTGESLELLKELRADLRKSVNLEKVPAKFRFVRFKNN